MKTAASRQAQGAATSTGSRPRIEQLAASCRGRDGGIVALFTGPSGTGKTMAAELLAAALGLRVYRVELSSVISKYIGETESNLDRIFAVAEHTGALLFFDEADELFGNRSGSGSDNASGASECLLRHLERSRGVVVLSSATIHGLHPLLRRRVHHFFECP